MNKEVFKEMQVLFSGLPNNKKEKAEYLVDELRAYLYAENLTQDLGLKFSSDEFYVSQEKYKLVLDVGVYSSYEEVYNDVSEALARM